MLLQWHWQTRIPHERTACASVPAGPNSRTRCQMRSFFIFFQNYLMHCTTTAIDIPHIGNITQLVTILTKMLVPSYVQLHSSSGCVRDVQVFISVRCKSLIIIALRKQKRHFTLCQFWPVLLMASASACSVTSLALARRSPTASGQEWEMHYKYFKHADTE